MPQSPEENDARWDEATRAAVAAAKPAPQGHWSTASHQSVWSWYREHTIPQQIGIAYVGLMIFGLILGMLWVGLESPEHAALRRRADFEAGRARSLVPRAESACRQAILKQLKAPKSASFDALAVTRQGETLLVTGTVDAQNVFGAMLRKTIMCTLSADGDTLIAAMVME